MATQPDDQTNGALPNGEDTSPQAGLISQYVKDLSFENPSAPMVYQWTDQPRIDVQFNIGAQQVGEEVHEVILKLDVKAETDQGVAFQVELTYGGLFGLRNIPADQVQPFLLIEGPRLMFPFARRVLADAVRDGGFQPLILEPIDFGAVYMQQTNAQAQQGAGGQEIDFSGSGNA